MIPDRKTFRFKDSFEHNGRTYYRYYLFNKKHTRVKIKIISSDSPCKQGIAIAMSVNPMCVGKVLFNGKEIDELGKFQKKIAKRKRKYRMVFVIDEKEFDIPEAILDFYVDEGEIFFGNASDLIGDYPGLIERVSELSGKTPDQFITYCYTSSILPEYIDNDCNSFWIETIGEKHLRFHCNDHHPDDDFDDLIFDMIFLDTEE